ncbi:hypothetical protein TNCV_1703491 [Trichonephila clavipes]|nr:hypothetical protein TNCV_1703491 [Trichonephila clavipes]
MRRGGPCADPLRSPIRDYWGRERGPPKGFKGSARKFMRISYNLLHYLPRQFFSSSKTLDKGCEATAPQGPRERNCDEL